MFRLNAIQNCTPLKWLSICRKWAVKVQSSFMLAARMELIMFNNKKLFSKIRKQAQVEMPDVWENILNAQNISETEAINIVRMQPQHNFNVYYRYAAAALSVIIIIMAVLIFPKTGMLFPTNKAVDTSKSSTTLNNSQTIAVTTGTAAYDMAGSCAASAVSQQTQSGVMTVTDGTTSKSKPATNSYKNTSTKAGTSIITSSTTGSKINSNTSGNEYSAYTENPFMSAATTPLSTFSVDVDTASYALIRRNLKNNQPVTPEQVRIEEMINYFKYDYAKPTGDTPFSITTELSDCPWKQGNKLLLIGLQGKEVDMSKIPPSNLVFLIDVSGSMSDADKLPLVKQAFSMLVENLRANDRISIVTYAGSESVVLQGVPGSDKLKITDAIDKLESGGSTAGADGIKTAYKIAEQNLLKNGNNRVILATDGDFNVGISSEQDLTTLIESKRSEGVYLSVMGFGTGNLKDNNLEALAHNGNGNYSYIDSVLEAKRVLIQEMGGTLLTIANDVKLQLEFDKLNVNQYRLLGYDNRIMASQDFNNDQKDAGDMGAGHRVTALYEIVPEVNSGQSASEWLKVNIRYKNPGETTSKLLSQTVNGSIYNSVMSDNFAFVSSVAEFGILLRNSQYKENASYQNAFNLIKNIVSIKSDQYKMEYMDLIRKLAD
jgi:Ca-activated chloride channel family protein